MNWLYFALTVSALLAGAWIVSAVRARAAWPAWVGGIGFLVVASMNSAALVRGLVDPDYVGFRFGFLQADRGIRVTLLAGALLLTAAIGAFSALRRERWAMRLTAAAAAVHLVDLGVPWAIAAATDPAGNSIQLGEYVTVPGAVGTALLFVLTVLPFVIVLAWSARKVAGGPRTT